MSKKMHAHWTMNIEHIKKIYIINIYNQNERVINYNAQRTAINQIKKYFIFTIQQYSNKNACIVESCYCLNNYTLCINL